MELARVQNDETVSSVGSGRRPDISVVFAGCNGIPHAPLANVNKFVCMAKALADTNIQVRAVNRVGYYHPEGPYNEAVQGDFEGLQYVTASGVAYRPESFIHRNLLRLKGLMIEVWWMAKWRFSGDLDVLILETPLLSNILFYRLLTKLLGVKLIYHYTEMWSSISGPNDGPRKRISRWMVDRLLHRLVDGMIPISDVLSEQVRRRDPGMPTLQVPVLCDFDKFPGARKPAAPRYFLYCGSTDYEEVIRFLWDAFERVMDKHNCLLHLVIHGRRQNIQRITSAAAQHPAAERIRFFHDLRYTELIHQYVHATALLIPLRPTLQDAARFPHKIGEYLASRSPVITTNYGEIRKYFVDQHNALVAAEYELSQFSDKMNWVLDNPEEAHKIGQRGYELGMTHFHYTAANSKLRMFIERHGVGRP